MSQTMSSNMGSGTTAATIPPSGVVGTLRLVGSTTATTPQSRASLSTWMNRRGICSRQLRIRRSNLRSCRRPTTQKTSSINVPDPGSPLPKLAKSATSKYKSRKTAQSRPELDSGIKVLGARKVQITDDNPEWASKADTDKFLASDPDAISVTFMRHLNTVGNQYDHLKHEYETLTKMGIPAPSLPETVTFTYDGEEYTIDPKTRKGVLNAMTSLSGLGLQQAEIAHDMLPEEIPDMIVLSNLPRTEEVGARVLKATDPDTNLPLSKFTFGEKSAIWKIGDSLVPVFRLKETCEGGYGTDRTDDDRMLFHLLSSAKSKSWRRPLVIGHGNDLAERTRKFGVRHRENTGASTKWIDYLDNGESRSFDVVLPEQTSLDPRFAGRRAEIDTMVSDMKSKLDMYRDTVPITLRMAPDSDAHTTPHTILGGGTTAATVSTGTTAV